MMNMLTVLVLIAGLFSTFVSPSGRAAAYESGKLEDMSNKIEAALVDQLQTQGQADFIVRFAAQADLSPAYDMDWQERGEFVYQILTETARRSQAEAIGVLDALSLEHQTFIAGNELYVWNGNLATASALAALPEVASIRASRTYSIDPVRVENPLVSVTWAGDLLAQNLYVTAGNAPNATAWGISYAKADQFWTVYDVQGGGILVANIDTGVQWNHPGLDQAYKCATDPGNAACWSDPSNICGGLPCDNNGHGTHTMGTMVADDDPTLPYQAGMAPDAQWIACKGCEGSSCSDSALNACADWILAPGGSPANRPNVVNNSWGGGGGDAWYQAKVSAWRAAGIFPAFSAGNSGPTCGSIGSPGDYQESFASAMINSSGTIDPGSSRGPSDYGHDPYTKPNIASPGVGICSTIPTNQWSCGYSGTSMASPHSAGAVALLWSCNPSLIGQIDQTFEILQDSAGATPAGNCSSPPDGEGNYTYGYGYLDVLTAGVLAGCGAGGAGTLEGYVTDADSGEPLDGVDVSASPSGKGPGLNAISDPTGYYSMTLPAGSWDVTASKKGYSSDNAQGIEILTGTVSTQDFELRYLGEWVQGPDISACFDLTRLDGEYFPADGKVYILGGRSGAATVGSIYSFDPLTGDCTDTGADMPVPISNYSVSLVNDGSEDLLCTFGGRNSGGSQVLDVQCYDPVANSAFVKAQLPAAYTGFNPGGQAVVDNQVYIFGGFRSTSAPYMLARTDRYEPVSNTFTRLGDLSLARSYIDVAVVDGKIYAFGGAVYDGANLTAQTRTEVMADPGGAGTWSDGAVTDLPTSSAEGRAFGFDVGSGYGLDGKVVIAGGGQWPNETFAVIAYDVASDTYDESFPDLITARRDHAGVFVPIETPDPQDGLPGMWVLGGRAGSDSPPYALPEFYPLSHAISEPEIVVDAPPLQASILEGLSETSGFTISNIGNAALEWSLEESSAVMAARAPLADVPWLSENPTSGSLGAGSTQPITVTFDTASLAPGEYLADLDVLSNDLDEPSITLPVTLTVLEMTEGVLLTPETDSRPGDPGVIVQYTLAVENTGNYTDTILISAAGNSWDVALPVTSLELAPEAREDVIVWVTVPPDALADESDTVMIRATSQRDTATYDTSTLTTEANAVYAVEMTPSTASQSGNPGKVVTYTLTVTNLGNAFDTYDLSYAGNTWEVELSATSLSLDIGESGEVEAWVTVDPEALAGDEDEVVVDVTSQGDPLQVDASTLTTTANAVYGVELTPGADSATGNPGEIVTYTLTVTNCGNIPDTFDLSYAGNSWSVALSAASLTLEEGESGEVSVWVTVEPGALAGEEDTVTVSATSQGDPLQVGVSILTTTANAVYGVEMNPEVESQSGNPGQVVTYTLTVTNQGNMADTFDLSYMGNTWEVALSTESLNLGVGESKAVLVWVTIAPDALAGEEDAVTVEATSQGDAGEMAISMLTTTANAVYEVEVTPGTDSQVVDPGKLVTYTLTLTNLGNITDTFNLSYAGNVWEVALSAMSLNLERGESGEVLVWVRVAPDALAGEVDMVSVTAVSQGNPEQTAEAMLDTTANAVYGFDLEVEEQTLSGTPGTVVTYTLMLTNQANISDTFELSYTSGWQVVGPASLEMSAGEELAFEVGVVIPASAKKGDLDLAEVMATGLGDGSQVTIYLTTTACIEEYWSFMPMIIK
jgi:uncharacterized membrane protein